MGRTSIPITLSVTETAHYRRLVDFVADVEQHAVDVEDIELYRLLTTLRHDLLDLGREPEL